MTSSSILSPFQNLNITAMQKDTPRLDLDSYISNYDGPLRLDRLIAIAKAPSILSLDALRLAVAAARSGNDTGKYTKLVEGLQQVAPNDPLAQLDKEYVSETNRKVKAESDRLEFELKQYKNNLIKESIRMGNEDLGNHYLSIGEYTTAAKCYTRMREYCTTPKHLAELNIKLLYVSILQQSWSNAQSYRLKMFSVPTKEDEKASPHEAVLNACTGLAMMNQGQYAEAADTLVSVSSVYATMDPLAGIPFQRAVLSPNDIAIYGGLCALATMDRAELKTKVLENQNFRQFLELESHLRRAINMFCSNKFSSCLAVLDTYAADYQLDLYLGPHFITLYRMIRWKSIVKWFSAFSVVTLDEIENSFPAMDDISIESELEGMITSGTLDARIDLVDRLLISPNPDPRLKVIDDTLTMAKAQRRALILRLHRSNMQSAGLEVKAPSGAAFHQNDRYAGEQQKGDYGKGFSFFGGGRKNGMGGASGSYMV